MPTTAPLTIDLTEVYAKLDGLDTRLARHDSQIDTATATVQGMLTRLDKLETPAPVPVPTPPNTPPLFERWKADVVKYADIHRAKLLDTTLSAADRLDLYYYDTAWIYHNLAHYLKRTDYLIARDEAIKIYRDEYLKPNDYKAAGWMIFPHGLYHHHKATGDEESKKALLSLSLNAAYAQKGEPINTWLGPTWLSREAAYNLMADLYAQDLGSTDTDIEALGGICIGHLKQWSDLLDGTLTNTTDQQDCRPFMVGITCQALIERHRRKTSAQIMDAIGLTLDLLWEKMYLPDSKSMKYTDRPIIGIGGPTPAPDLNMLIAPAYAWIGQRDRADLLFQGSVEGAFLAGHKQFAQSVRWVFDYLNWRQA